MENKSHENPFEFRKIMYKALNLALILILKGELIKKSA